MLFRSSVADSRKGGAIVLGAQKAIREGHSTVIYTDADTSVHLGQIGLLLQPFVVHGKRVVAGNRKDPHSVFVKQEARFGVGIKLIRHMQRMIGASILTADFMDSQAPFKLYEATLLEKIIATMSVYDFRFDLDWILSALDVGVCVEAIPFAFIDSQVESTLDRQGAAASLTSLLQGLLHVVRAHHLPHNLEMAAVVEQEIQTPSDLAALMRHVPPELERVTDRELGDPAILSPAEVRAWIQYCKAMAHRNSDGTGKLIRISGVTPRLGAAEIQWPFHHVQTELLAETRDQIQLLCAPRFCNPSRGRPHKSILSRFVLAPPSNRMLRAG